MTLSFRTIVRGSLVVFGLAALAAQGANAATVTTIFNTGQATNTPNTLEAANTTDMHYTVSYLGTTAPTGPGTAFISTIVVDPTTFPGGGPYAGNQTQSEYVAPSSSVASTGQGANLYNNPAGYYDYRTTFSLAGFQAGTAALSGGISADNSVFAIFLNGVAQTTPSGVGLTAVTAFNVGSGFNGALNTLDFIVLNNADGPGQPASSLPANINATAFRADVLTLTATAIPAAVPEPGSVAMLVGLGVTGAGFLSRRKRSSK